ncbi:diguanylate cyclase [Acetoanaerobium sticklandii]|uniref:diguanylate cyclase n=1 Tax=Acetoanaerobium sticklandii TaxID=1511 RepID=UPI003A908A6D
MNFDVYSATIGITIAIVFQFIALIFHVKMHKKEQFIMWWVLGMGLSVVGLLTIYLRTFPSLNRGALIVSNALTIFGQGAFFIAIESYLNKNIKVNKLKTILATGIIVLIYFSVFSEITVLRMLTTSIVLLVFSVLIVRRLYLSKSDDNKDNINFMIATFLLNAIYWIARAAIVIFILPTHPEIYDIILIFSYIMVLLVCTLGTLGLILLINKNLVEREEKERLKAEKERLKFLTIIETSPDLILVSKLSDGEIVLANKVFLDTLGYETDEVVGKTTMELNIWENSETRAKFANDLKINKKLSHYENRFVRKDKSKFIGSMSVSTITIEDEVFIISIARDVTELKEIEEILQESKNKFETIAMSSASWEAWFDEKGVLVWTNDLIEAISGLTLEEDFAKNDLIRNLLISDDSQETLDEKFKTTLELQRSGSSEARIKSKDGSCKWILINWRPVISDKGEFKGFRTSIVDITEKKKAEFAATELAQQLKKEKEVAERNSLTDGMTGLANRRYLDEQIMLEYFRMKRTGEKLSIIMLDVDFFKLYNDAYGHLQGDECLKMVAKVLKTTIKRATDIAARYGGEEFVVLLPDTDEIGAIKVAETLRANVEAMKMEHKDSRISDVVTVSIGVATFDKHSLVAPENLVQKADEALYEAKNSGRNKVMPRAEELKVLDSSDFLKVVWSSKFESGHEGIDAQHKELFDDSNEIFESILSVKTKEEQLESLMKIMDDLKEHFDYEEEVLREIGYPEVNYHAVSHMNLMNNAKLFIDKFQKDEVEIIEVLNFIIFEVIADHLYRQDRLYFPYLEKV